MLLGGETVDKQEHAASGVGTPGGADRCRESSFSGQAAGGAERVGGRVCCRWGGSLDPSKGAALGSRDPQMRRGGSCGGRGVGDPLKGCVVAGREEARVEKWDQGAEDEDGSRSAEGDPRAQVTSRLQRGGRSVRGGRVGTEGKRPGAGHCPGEMGEAGNPPSLRDPMWEGSSFPVKEGRREERCGGLEREGTSS